MKTSRSENLILAAGAAGLAALIALSAESWGQIPPPPPPIKKKTPAYAQIPPITGKGWKSLFDGKTLKGWKITDFAGHGPVYVKDGKMILEMGAILTGVNGPTNLFKTNYEIVLDAMRVDGTDFFCGLTFPVGDSCCSLIVGGWGGGVVGISSLDDLDASMNETTTFMNFENDRWHRIRVCVTTERLQAWIGKQKVADVAIKGRRITVRPGEIELSQPFGIATYQTTGAFRNIMWRPLSREEAARINAQKPKKRF
ncbi:MAG: DUF1080 domain-containing protein [Verrucomicrobia bacterium]|nr:DUF1080 domain-containing protein [Verrucomicrobiota bacterium]